MRSLEVIFEIQHLKVKFLPQNSLILLHFIFEYERLTFFTLGNAIKTLNINLHHIINEVKTQISGGKKNTGWGHTLKTTLRDAILCMYNHMISRDIWGDTILTSEVIRGHRRSTFSKWGHALTIRPRDVIFVCIFMWPLQVWNNIWIWPQMSFEVTGGKN